MGNKITNFFLKELAKILSIFGALFLIFLIAYHKEKIGNIFFVSATMIWLFFIPGYLILYYWINRLDFVERMILAYPLSYAVIGIISYYTTQFLPISIDHLKFSLVIIIAISSLSFSWKKIIEAASK